MSKARSTKPVAKKKPAPAKKANTPSTAASMKTSEIRDLIDFISKTGLNEVDIETSELKLHVKREPDQKILKSSPVVTSMVPSATALPANPVASAAVQQSAPETKPEASTSGKNVSQIKSPMIGTFYRSPNPDSPPFVSVGDKISKGQTVCIIEAMKLFNEIEAEISGTVVKVYLENSTPVEYDQVLFDVEPD